MTGRSGYLDAEAALSPLLGFPIGTFGAAGQGLRDQWDYKNRALSIFGQADFELTDRLTLSGGFNFTNDRKRVASNGVSTDVFSSLDFVAIGGALLAMNPNVPPSQIPTLAQNPAFNPLLGLQALQFLPPFLNFPNAVEDGRTRDNNLSYTLRASYKFDDRISGYLTYATGFKASSWNLSRDSRPSRANFIPGSPITSPTSSPIRAAGLALPNLSAGSRFADPETAEVFEAGMKGQFDGFSFNLAVFKQSLRGFQSNVFTGTGFILGNADKQSTFGVELDTLFTPIRDLNVTASFTYLNPKFDSFPDGAILGPGFTTIPADLTGQRPAGIPEFSIAVGATYTQRMSDSARLIWHVDYALESPTAIADGRPDITREVESLNASLTLGIGNHLEFTLWGRNLSNEQFLYSIAPLPIQPGSLLGYPSMPRTYGGLIRYRF